MSASYDVYPYESFAITPTHPQHLMTLGKLSGLEPPTVETAHILELGAASGGNLIPLAYHYPQAHFVGIDLSFSQVQHGHQHIKNLALKNIELRHQDILAFKDEKQFDYIICHGLYSWVSPDVQRTILAICKRYLSPTGIAYISYNTFPGWLWDKSLQDLWRWQLRETTPPLERLTIAKSVLANLQLSLREDSSPYAQLFHRTLKLVADHSDLQLLHEDLSPNTHALYFYQFIEQITDAKLTYITDAQLMGVDAAELAPTLLQALNEFTNNTEKEQWWDLLKNQRFRCSLIGHINKFPSIDLSQWNSSLSHIHHSHSIQEVKPYPIACPFARYQLIHQEIVTNCRHQNLRLNPIAECLFPFLDGKHSIGQLYEIIEKYLAEGILDLVDDQGFPLRGSNKIQQEITKLVTRTLETLASNALLVNN